MSASELGARPPNRVPREFWKGEMWWTLRVSQVLASHLAWRAGRSGFSPNMLSLANAVCGISTSAVVIALYPKSQLAAGIAALLGWQLAYCLDCADGQLARSANRTSSLGALLDIGCDYVVQIGVVVALVSIADHSVSSNMAAPAAVVIAGGWLIALFFASVGPSIERSVGYEVVRHRLVLVKQVRDYGLQVCAFPVLMIFGGVAVAVGLAVVAAANFGFLTVRIAALKLGARVP
jgi:phosphatidylglycerophosphate synthase